MWKILRPPKHKPPVAAEKIDKEYKRLRLQVFIGIFIGYARYYLVRKNFTLAMPHLGRKGFDKGDLGIALSANAIAYGLSKFLMGGVSDRSNARVFLPLGLVLSALGDDVPRDIGRYLVDHHDVHHAVPHRLVPGYGLAPVRTRHDPLVLAERTRHEMSVWNVAHNVGGGMIGRGRPTDCYGSGRGRSVRSGSPPWWPSWSQCWHSC